MQPFTVSAKEKKVQMFAYREHSLHKSEKGYTQVASVWDLYPVYEYINIYHYCNKCKFYQLSRNNV